MDFGDLLYSTPGAVSFNNGAGTINPRPASLTPVNPFDPQSIIQNALSTAMAGANSGPSAATPGTANQQGGSAGGTNQYYPWNFTDPDQEAQTQSAGVLEQHAKQMQGLSDKYQKASDDANQQLQAIEQRRQVMSAGLQALAQQAAADKVANVANPNTKQILTAALMAGLASAMGDKNGSFANGMINGYMTNRQAQEAKNQEDYNQRQRNYQLQMGVDESQSGNLDKEENAVDRRLGQIGNVYDTQTRAADSGLTADLNRIAATQKSAQNQNVQYSNQATRDTEKITPKKGPTQIFSDLKAIRDTQAHFLPDAYNHTGDFSDEALQSKADQIYHEYLTDPQQGVLAQMQKQFGSAIDKAQNDTGTKAMLAGRLISYAKQYPGLVDTPEFESQLQDWVGSKSAKEQKADVDAYVDSATQDAQVQAKNDQPALVQSQINKNNRAGTGKGSKDPYAQKVKAINDAMSGYRTQLKQMADAAKFRGTNFVAPDFWQRPEVVSIKQKIDDLAGRKEQAAETQLNGQLPVTGGRDIPVEPNPGDGNFVGPLPAVTPDGQSTTGIIRKGGAPSQKPGSQNVQFQVTDVTAPGGKTAHFGKSGTNKSPAIQKPTKAPAKQVGQIRYANPILQALRAPQRPPTLQSPILQALAPPNPTGLAGFGH